MTSLNYFKTSFSHFLLKILIASLIFPLRRVEQDFHSCFNGIRRFPFELIIKDASYDPQKENSLIGNSQVGSPRIPFLVFSLISIDDTIRHSSHIHHNWTINRPVNQFWVSAIRQLILNCQYVCEIGNHESCNDGKLVLELGKFYEENTKSNPAKEPNRYADGEERNNGMSIHWKHKMSIVKRQNFRIFQIEFSSSYFLLGPLKIVLWSTAGAF